MIAFVSRLFGRATPAFAPAQPRDAAAIAILHGASFQRGWSEDEIRLLLLEASVLSDSAAIDGKLVGFIMSRMAADEAEILSVAIAPAWRGRGFSRPILDRHLRRLAGIGTNAVFLEVDEHNAPARRLYERAGFREVGRRQGYYGGTATALTLRRDLGAR